MTEEELQKLSELKGLVATTVTTGHVESTHSWHMQNVRSHCDRTGFHNVEWRIFHAVLVESGRDRVIQHALDQEYDWVMQIDADAAPIPQDIVQRLLHNLFIRVTDADVMGVYCQLKGTPNLPTIDTGTGKWEVHYSGSGVLPVIRTGAHCFMGKTSAYKKFGPPWYKARFLPENPIQPFHEVDNLARCWSHGENPLAGEDWDKLIESARANYEPGPSGSVGEDSGFCDALKAAGGKIYVDTDIVVGHVTKKLIKPEDLKENMEDRERTERMMCGILE